jgi:hypothetical protein
MLAPTPNPHVIQLTKRIITDPHLEVKPFYITSLSIPGPFTNDEYPFNSMLEDKRLILAAIQPYTGVQTKFYAAILIKTTY